MLNKNEEKRFEYLIKKWTNHFKYLGKEKHEKKYSQRLNQEKYYNEKKVFDNIKKNILSNYSGFFNKKLEVLEVGCGMGGLLVNLVKSDIGDIKALEFNKEYCEITKLRLKKNNCKAEVKNGGIENYKEQNKNDLIIMMDVLEHVQNPELGLKKLYLSMKKGGLIYLTVINRFALLDPHYNMYLVNFLPRKIGSKIANKKTNKNYEIFQDQQDLDKMHYFTQYSFNRLCKKVGFKKITWLDKSFYSKTFGSTWTLIVEK